MPIIVSGGSIALEDKKSHNRTYKTLLILNIVGPVIEMAVSIPLNIALFTDFKDPSLAIEISTIVSSTFSESLQIVSGVVLVNSVLKIKRFYRDKDMEDRLNTRTLLVHSTAFILYLISTILQMVLWDLFVAFSDDTTLEDSFFISNSVKTMLSDVS
jgi:predicted membrane protein